MHPSVTMKRAYGARFARTFLDEIVAAAPDVPVQVAHLGGAGRFDELALVEVLDVFAKAVADGDPHMRNVYFDMSGIADLAETPEKAALAARRIRELGVQRVLFGSDGAPCRATRRTSAGRRSGRFRCPRRSSARSSGTSHRTCADRVTRK